MEGLFRSTVSERDQVRRRLLGLTAAAGVAATAAVGGLCVGLVPAGAGQQPAGRPPGRAVVGEDGGPAQHPARQHEPDPVATSGAS